MAGDILSIPTQGSAYVVKSGDFLRKIAVQAYGDEAQWTRIWDANTQLHSRKIRPPYVNKEDLIYPGDTLFIPPLAPETPAPPDDGSMTSDAPVGTPPEKKRGKIKFLPDGAPIIGAEVTLGDQILNCTQGQFTYGLDTFSPCWIVTVPWDPGKDEAFDRNSKRGSYAPSTIRLNGELKGTGRLYIRSPSMSASGITKQLTFFSKTKDLLDSSLSTKFKDYPTVTLKSYAEDCCGALGYNVDCQTDTGKPFDNIQWEAGLKIGEVLQNLASLRGFYVTSDAEGGLVFWKLHTRNQEPAAFIYAGGDIALGFNAAYDDTKRFRRYGAYSESGDGESIFSEATDLEVPADVFRELAVRADKTDRDTAKTAAAWVAMKIYLQSMEIQIPVKDWLDETGKVWSPQDMVYVQNPALEIDKPTPFIIRTVDFTWGASGRGCTLHLIPAIDVRNAEIVPAGKKKALLTLNR